MHKLEVDYLGTESFTSHALKGIQEVLASHEQSASLKSFTLRMPRDLFKANFDRTLRESDFNQIRIFRLIINDN